MSGVLNPLAAVKAHLARRTRLRRQCVLLRRREPGSQVHVFGYLSDLSAPTGFGQFHLGWSRHSHADILFTSLLVQMARGLALQPVPGYVGGAKAWRRS